MMEEMTLYAVLLKINQRELFKHLIKHLEKPEKTTICETIKVSGYAI